MNPRNRSAHVAEAEVGRSSSVWIKYGVADHVAQEVKTTVGSSSSVMSELKQETTEYILNIAIFINYKD